MNTTAAIIGGAVWLLTGLGLWRCSRALRRARRGLAEWRTYDAFRQDVGSRNRSGLQAVSDPDPAQAPPAGQRHPLEGRYWPTEHAARLLHGDEGGGAA